MGAGNRGGDGGIENLRSSPREVPTDKHPLPNPAGDLELYSLEKMHQEAPRMGVEGQ